MSSPTFGRTLSDMSTKTPFPLDVKIRMGGTKREGGPTAAELENQREEPQRGTE